ncbi:MAG: HD domain-containing protein [Pseudomonadota bacterium]|nr:HD domain-containing protein [Pseudomonadota bacterium]
MSILSFAGHTISKVFVKGTDKIINRIDNYFDGNNNKERQLLPQKSDNERSKKGKKKQIKVKLEDLSTIWLKYNNTFLSDKIQENKQEERQTGQENAPLTVEKTDDVPDSVEKQNAAVSTIEKEKGIYILTAEANKFYTDCIDPHRTVLENRNVLDKVNNLVEIIDRYGDCPSLVISKDFKDEESDDLSSIVGLLSKVTAKNHTFRTVRIALKLIKDEYCLPDAYIPSVIIAALGHDIGKFPEYRKGNTYQKLDHPIVSAKVVETILSPKEITWIGGVLEAIKMHHSNTTNNNDTVLMVLKDADSKAREEEVAGQSQGLKSKSFDEWFDVKEYLSIIQPHINVTQTNNKWSAFSHNGVVYLAPEFVYQIANDYAIKKGIINIQLIQRKNFEKVVKIVVKKLYDCKMLTPDMKENWYYRRYVIETQKGNKIPNINLVPIVENNFENVAEIERIKDAISDNIINVEVKIK